MRLENKIALIIGAGQAPGASDAIGNGRATALVFAREGARICCVDRHLDSAEETAAMIAEKGGEAFAAAADVTDEAAIQAAVAACTDRWDRIDILHNNVGVSVEGGDAPLADVTTEAFDRVMDVNLLGTMLTCKHVLPVMRAQKGGAIIGVGSVAGDRGRIKNYVYGAAKAAFHTYLSGLRNRLARSGAHVMTVKPGFVDTAMTWGLPGMFLVAQPRHVAKA